ncbi:hypothetical protein J1N35_027617 [Gossypium stocksii]|uniref:Uncharacterized protein n=1 Tax=Gossypium stocksii TaxID=47602 RepID=A0A9D3ZZX8_9ROSI|nr:hypothetical protein J1N35_027617 [Gossypium stocksii]
MLRKGKREFGACYYALSDCYGYLGQSWQDTFLQDWREATIVFQRVQGASFGHPSRLLYWLTPPSDCFKCNVDAAILSGWNVIVLAAMIHGDQGQFIKGHAIVLRSVF